MDKTFTASEVRELANFLNTEQAIGAAELHAYADRLEADEQAQAQSGEWVMVPRIPTKAMMEVACEIGVTAEDWHEMLIAAQAQPPAASVTDEMIERARSAFVQADDGSTGITDAIRAVLLAAHLAYPQPSRDAKDAARYRWLRDSADSYTWYYLGGIGADRVDAAVDAAMAKECGQ